ncbi:uncharacterized protein LOC108106080 [Drosophila eugracilis]|uniref:uncharacterized protein LOC108106080 n=1 Tax=Drosophila eugracilis TaxID=29029 RepID=UPI001BD9FDB2|nr:uncharacterized protein LOC108106080 [Drosophila eugracilis]
MSLHKCRFLLAESITLLRHQNQNLHKMNLNNARNGRALNILLGKLESHKSHSLYLQKYFKNLYKEIYGLDCFKKGKILQSQLKLIRRLTKGNRSEAENCFKWAENIILNFGLGGKNVPKGRVQKRSFEKPIVKFFKAIKIHKKINTEEDINGIKEIKRSPYEMTNKRKFGITYPELVGQGSSFGDVTKLRKKFGKRIIPKEANYFDSSDYLKDHRGSIDLSEPKVALKILKNMTVNIEENVERNLRETPYGEPQNIKSKENIKEFVNKFKGDLQDNSPEFHINPKKSKIKEKKHKFLNISEKENQNAYVNKSEVNPNGHSSESSINLKKPKTRESMNKIKNKSDQNLQGNLRETFKVIQKKSKISENMNRFKNKDENHEVNSSESYIIPKKPKNKENTKKFINKSEENFQKYSTESYNDQTKPKIKENLNEIVYNSEEKVLGNFTETSSGIHKNKLKEISDNGITNQLKSILSKSSAGSKSLTEMGSSKKMSTIDKSNNRSFTYENLKSIYHAFRFKPKRQSDFKRKLPNFNPSKRELLTQRNSKDYFSQFNKRLSTESTKSLEKNNAQQPAMSAMATAIINGLNEEKTITLDESKKFVNNFDATRMSSNNFLGKISMIKPADQMNAVWSDLVETHKGWSENAKTPEDAEKLKKILKWRYIHNVQKLLHNNVKWLKIEQTVGRPEAGTKKPQMANKNMRSSYQVPNTYGSFPLFKKLSNTGDSQLKILHESFIRTQMDMLRSRIFDKDVELMNIMIMGRQVPEDGKDLEIFKKYKTDPQHYNILILSLGKHISDEKYEEKLPILERNFQYISHQMEVLSREKRKKDMQIKNYLQKAEEELFAKCSGESIHIDPLDLSEAFLEQRREMLATYIAQQAKTPTEILLAAVRKQKRKAQLAAKKEEREQRRKQEQQFLKNRRPLSALYKAPRQTHRERQAIKDIQEELQGMKTKCSASSLCCRRCSKCGLIWTQKCSEDSTDGIADHICSIK